MTGSFRDLDAGSEAARHPATPTVGWQVTRQAATLTTPKADTLPASVTVRVVTDDATAKLSEIVLDCIAFLEHMPDEVIDPDAAVKMLESIAAGLGELSEADQQAFIAVAARLAEDAHGDAHKELLLSIGEMTGIGASTLIGTEMRGRVCVAAFDPPLAASRLEQWRAQNGESFGPQSDWIINFGRAAGGGDFASVWVLPEHAP